jgi:AcrR family transcriptional regulator
MPAALTRLSDDVAVATAVLVAGTPIENPWVTNKTARTTAVAATPAAIHGTRRMPLALKVTPPQVTDIVNMMFMIEHSVRLSYSPYEENVNNQFRWLCAVSNKLKAIVPKRGDRPMAAKEADRRVRRTRRALQDALGELIVEKGYGSVTVQDILDRADVGRSTFYTHFRDKDQLLLSGFERLVPMLEQHRVGALDGSAVMDDMPVAFLRHVAEQHRVFKALFGNPAGNMLLSHVQEYLANYAREVMGARLAGSEPAVPLEVAANFVAGSFLAMVGWWVQNDMPYSAEEMSVMLGKLMGHGVLGALGESAQT